MTAPTVDWERIEAEFRAGVLSTSQIARAHGITEGAIRKRAKRDGWERDLAGKVTAKTRNLLVREAVRKEGAGTMSRTERETVEIAAMTQVEVIRSHRTRIARLWEIGFALESRLRVLAAEPENLQGLALALADAEKMTGEEMTGVMTRARAAIRSFMDVGEHVGTFRDLSTALKTLTGMEREAFNITEGDGKTEETFEQRMIRMDAEAKATPPAEETPA